MAEPGPALRQRMELAGILEVAGRAHGRLEFEATGPASLMRSELEATAAFVFAEAMPGGVELGADDSHSYAQWFANSRVPSGAGLVNHRG